MAQRLKTDWILFVTVLAMVSLRRADRLQRVVDHGADGSAIPLEPGTSCMRQVGVGGDRARRHDGAEEARTTASCRTRRSRSSAIGVSLFLLVAVYFLDPANHRWLRLGGPVGVQPSELAKPALVIFLAFFVTWRARAINNPRYTLVPAALAVGLVILAVVVADLGTAIVLGAAAAWSSSSPGWRGATARSSARSP